MIWLVLVLRQNKGGRKKNTTPSAQEGKGDTDEKSSKRDGKSEEEEKSSEETRAPSEEPETEFRFEQVYSLADDLDDFIDQSAHPRDFLDREEFQQGVQRLRDSSLSDSDLISYGAGGNLAIASMALEALSQRKENDDPTEQVLEIFNGVRLWTHYFALKALRPAEGRSLIGAVLAHVNTYWNNNLFMQTLLREFIEERLKAGEVLSFKGYLTGAFEDRASGVEHLIETLRITKLEPLQSELQEWQRSRVDVKKLRGIGSVWEMDKPVEPIIEHPAMDRILHEAEQSLLSEPKRSVLLIGENGVGKTTLCTVLARRLQKEGWTIFEAGATEVLAGQVYIGELEGRIQELIQNLGGNRKVLWIVPNFQQLVYAGWHKSDPRSILDMLLPALENGELTVVGEIEPEAYERLLQNKAHMRTLMKGITVTPMDSEETLALTHKWNAVSNERNGVPLISANVLEEAFHLARQFLDKAAAPGNLIGLLKWTQQSMPDTESISTEDVLRSLTHLTGLPSSILDQREDLDLGALRSLFQKRVLGQPEAVDCLVDRVAMIKAGLNDPTRPAGVFLFVGPTGTGKTEIAKTLAEFLFGSSERMIRLDMSEFMTDDSLDRIIGDRDRGSESRALVNLIRNQPFSVILLDEFEKAHHRVWDLFLQVFDDGRLSDRLGNTADFRHSIIIMTSNLGAAIPHGSGLGFSGGRKGFSESSVMRAVKTAFRPEFLNRIDRVVVFRPLSRAIVREILLKELNDVLSRRGFRNRDWAVEWEESALDFLLNKGFTEELGCTST